MTDGSAPTFTNLPASVDVYDDTVLGFSLFTVTFNDSNTAELSSLVLSVSQYEPQGGTQAIAIDLNTGHVTTASQLYVGTVTLTLTVTDPCGLSDIQTLTINIINKPPVIANLPAAVDLSETVTLETLLYTLLVSDPSGDIVTCTSSSTSPNAPFHVNLIPGTTNYGVYSNVMPNLDHTITSQYTMIINCTDTKDITSGQFDINILPNTAPVFLNIPASITIATTTQIGTVVYTVLAADNETNDLTFSFDGCGGGCWFRMADTGQVILSDNALLTTDRVVYQLNIRVNDGSLTATTTPLSIIISGSNNQPVINNLPLTLNFLESDAIGTVIFTLDVTEPNADDVLNYVITYSPSSAASKFRFDTDTNQLTMIQSLDFESGITQYDIGYTVDDGTLTSGPLNLIINVIDKNEAPTISNEIFYLSTSENHNIGYTLPTPNANFIVTDPDAGDSLTYSITSGDPWNRFTINPTSGALQFAVRYDIDDGRMPEEVNLTITVTDNGGLSASTIIQVTFTDSNDNRPYFTSDTYEANIPNDYPIRASVLSVSAVDIDVTYSDIQYSLIDGDLQYFDIKDDGWIYLAKSVAVFYNYTTLSVRVQVVSSGHYTYCWAYILVSPALEDNFFNHPEHILLVCACIVAVILLLILSVLMVYRYRRYGYACTPKKWSQIFDPVKHGWQTFQSRILEGVNACRGRWKTWRKSRKEAKRIPKPKTVVFSSEKAAPPRFKPKERCLRFIENLRSCLPKRKRKVERIQVAPVIHEAPAPLTQQYNWEPWMNKWEIAPEYSL